MEELQKAYEDFLVAYNNVKESGEKVKEVLQALVEKQNHENNL